MRIPSLGLNCEAVVMAWATMQPWLALPSLGDQRKEGAPKLMGRALAHSIFRNLIFKRQYHNIRAYAMNYT
jgi:hypothetical protein